MSFTSGILNLTNWVGNVILPTLAGLFFAIAILRFVRSESYVAEMYGGFLCLMASGLLRAMETFASQRPWNDPDVYSVALLSLVNWVCNVLMPIYAFVAAALCLLLSGLLRLAEFFVIQGTGGVT